MTTDIATTDHDGALALTADQTYWTPGQVAALRHIGVENATDGDLTVFHHVCQRTGLDPFARQIYMIGRNARENINGEWQYVTKYTIQTGIDGFRLIGRRAADRAHHQVSVAAPEWAHEDGSWRPVWRNAWGVPVAARVIIKRAGEPFEAVALFDEYKQAKRDGTLTQMWAQRPAGQIAKCAEALAWRMAFPQDLSGLYTDDEMGQAERADQIDRTTAPLGASAADRMHAALGTPQTSGPEAPGEDAPTSPVERPHSGPESDPAVDVMLDTRSSLAKRMYASLREAQIEDKDERLAYIGATIGRQIESSSEMTEGEASLVITKLAELPKGGQS